MRLQSFLSIGLAVFLTSFAASLFPQTAPEATKGGLPLEVGVGMSDYNLDYGGGRTMLGDTLWIDWDFWTLAALPSYLRGFGIEAKGRNINYDRSRKH